MMPGGIDHPEQNVLRNICLWVVCVLTSCRLHKSVLVLFLQNVHLHGKKSQTVKKVFTEKKIAFKYIIILLPVGI